MYCMAPVSSAHGGKIYPCESLLLVLSRQGATHANMKLRYGLLLPGFTSYGQESRSVREQSVTNVALASHCKYVHGGLGSFPSTWEDKAEALPGLEFHVFPCFSPLAASCYGQKSRSEDVVLPAVTLASPSPGMHPSWTIEPLVPLNLVPPTRVKVWDAKNGY